MAKDCWCGSLLCPICKGKLPPGSPLDAEGIPLAAKRGTFRNAGVSKRAVSVPKPNVSVSAENASVAVIGRAMAVSVDGVYSIPCACGCEKMVKVGPVYASTACRSRAWRKGKATIRWGNRKEAHFVEAEDPQELRGVTLPPVQVSPPFDPTAKGTCTCGPGEKAKGKHNRYCPLRRPEPVEGRGK